MPIKINAIDVVPVINDEAIGKVYIGEQLVYQSQPIEIWQDMILSVQRYTTNTYSGSESYTADEIIGFTVTAGATGASVTYDGITKNVSANTTTNLIWGKYKGVDDGTASSGNITFSGEYTVVEPLNHQSGKLTTERVRVVLSVIQMCGAQVITLDNMFINQSLLTTVLKIPYNTKVSSVSSMFSGCSSLANVPQDLFNLLPNLITYKACFYNCIALTSIVKIKGVLPWFKIGLNGGSGVFEIGCYEGCINLVSPSLDEMPSSWGGGVPYRLTTPAQDPNYSIEVTIFEPYNPIYYYRIKNTKDDSPSYTEIESIDVEGVKKIVIAESAFINKYSIDFYAYSESYGYSNIISYTIVYPAGVDFATPDYSNCSLFNNTAYPYLANSSDSVSFTIPENCSVYYILGKSNDTFTANQIYSSGKLYTSPISYEEIKTKDGYAVIKFATKQTSGWIASTISSFNMYAITRIRDTYISFNDWNSVFSTYGDIRSVAKGFVWIADINGSPSLVMSSFVNNIATFGFSGPNMASQTLTFTLTSSGITCESVGQPINNGLSFAGYTVGT